jgi:hypothetical protein
VYDSEVTIISGWLLVAFLIIEFPERYVIVALELVTWLKLKSDGPILPVGPVGPGTPTVPTQLLLFEQVEFIGTLNLLGLLSLFTCNCIKLRNDV